MTCPQNWGKIKDLVFAKTEGTAILKEIWRRKGTVEVCHGLPNRNPHNVLTRLHAAGHGKLTKRRRSGFRAQLCLGDGTVISDREILSSRCQAEGVWLSACIVGQTQEDEEGDPAGLVTAFLLQGSRCVIGALDVVPDQWMPLVVGLTEWVAVNENVPLSQALRVAKSVLADWPLRESFTEFQVIYKSWVRETWVGILSESWNYAGFHDAGQWTEFIDEFFAEQGAYYNVPPPSLETRQLFLTGNRGDRMDVQEMGGPLLDYLVASSLIPPETIRLYLCTVVQAFGR